MAVLTFSVSRGGAENFASALRPLAVHAQAFLRYCYYAAPMMTVAVLFAVALPLMAAVVRLSKPLTRSKNATLRYRPGRHDAFEANIEERAGAHCRNPVIEIENGRGMRCAILRDMLRIGREDDNDIRIPSRYVHRYHAAIHREDFDDWHITDLTGVESNGLIVNGKRCCEARLRDGDLIQLGPGKLRFRMGAA